MQTWRWWHLINSSAEKMVNQTCPEPLIRIPYGARTAKSLDIREKSAGRFMEGHNSGRIIETGSWGLDHQRDRLMCLKHNLMVKTILKNKLSWIGSRNVKELEGIGEARSYRYLFLSALSSKTLCTKCLR